MNENLFYINLFVFGQIRHALMRSFHITGISDTTFLPDVVQCSYYKSHNFFHFNGDSMPFNFGEKQEQGVYPGLEKPSNTGFFRLIALFVVDVKRGIVKLYGENNLINSPLTITHYSLT
ncbi:hypothetical protein AU377_06580 [Sporosarcina sp. HYO08]|nr:hypothetical protein AU377_06580 [Sporosarcina sp. HYO08]